MKKSYQIGALVVLTMFSSVAFAVEKAATPNSEIENRIQRLERMANNPVLLKLSQRLSIQQREIADLHDKLDRLRHELRKAKEQSAKQYQDSDYRLTQLEEGQSAEPSTETPKLPGLDGSAPVLEGAAAASAGATGAALAETASPEAGLTADSNTDATVGLEADGALNKTNEGVTPPDDLPALEAASMAASKEIAVRPATAEEKKTYKEAFALMKQKKYQEAIDAFEAFRLATPESALASNTAYWSGEGYLVLGDKEKALASFQLVKTHYPSSTKAPAALLREADTQRDLKQIAEAKKLYQTLLETYPDNRVAKKAKQRLEALDK